jgi:hypothetical protein
MSRSAVSKVLSVDKAQQVGRKSSVELECGIPNAAQLHEIRYYSLLVEIMIWRYAAIHPRIVQATRFSLGPLKSHGRARPATEFHGRAYTANSSYGLQPYTLHTLLQWGTSIQPLPGHATGRRYSSGCLRSTCARSAGQAAARSIGRAAPVQGIDFC